MRVRRCLSDVVVSGNKSVTVNVIFKLGIIQNSWWIFVNAEMILGVLGCKY